MPFAIIYSLVQICHGQDEKYKRIVDDKNEKKKKTLSSTESSAVTPPKHRLGKGGKEY